MLINKHDFERCFKGFEIKDCAIRNRNIFYFVTLAEHIHARRPPPEEDRTTKVIVYFAEKPEDKRWGYVSYEGCMRMHAGAAQQPEEKFIGVDWRRQVVTIGGGAADNEEDIPVGRPGPARGIVRKTKTINGYLHACTGYRGLGRRDGPSRWTSLCTGMDYTPDPDQDSDHYGFNDFDAFGTDEFYCVGGDEDVWHLKDNVWKQLKFPKNTKPETVCCAGDGVVYISGRGGSVWKGRGDDWKLIHRGYYHIPFKDMVWFMDRVYCTSKLGLWEIMDDRLWQCDVPPEIDIYGGNLAVGDGVMLLAGPGGCAYHNGEKWTQMVDTAAF